MKLKQGFQNKTSLNERKTLTNISHRENYILSCSIVFCFIHLLIDNIEFHSRGTKQCGLDDDRPHNFI